MSNKLDQEIVSRIEAWGHGRWSAGRRAGIEESREPDRYGFPELAEDVRKILGEASLPCQDWYHGMCHDRCARAMKIMRYIEPNRARRYDEIRAKMKADR